MERGPAPDLTAPDEEHLRYRLQTIALELDAPGLPTRTRSDLYRTHARLTKLLEKVRREVDEREARLVSTPHPLWTKVVRAFTEVLRHRDDGAEAAKALRDAIAEELRRSSGSR